MKLKQIARGYLRYISSKKTLSASTGMLIFITPLAVSVEKAATISDANSMRSRGITVGLMYLGLSALLKVREYSKKRLGMSPESNRALKYVHDGLFSVGCAAIIRPTIYLFAGETDWRKIAAGTLGNMAVSAVLGGPLLHFVDTYNDLTGVEESERTPELLKRQSPGVKKRIAAGLAAASISLAGLIYYATPSNNEPNNQVSTQQVESALENSFQDSVSLEGSLS